jgi:hypothetical protein
MKRSFKLAFVLGGLLAATGLISAGQLSGTLSGPKLGYLWNGSDSSLRPILGILGSSTLGAPLDTGFTISRAFALDGNRFIASTDKHSSAVFINLASTPASVVAMTDAPAQPTSVVGSRAATAAAIYYAAQQRILVVTGLPASPKVSRIVDLSAAGQDLSRYAVSDDGNILLYSVPSGERDSLFAWTAASGHRLLTVADSITDIALAPNGTAIVADAKANEVFSIASGSGARQVLTADTNVVATPTGVAVSSSGLIYVANAGTNTILTLDSSGRPVRSQACGCTLSRFIPFKDSVYRLSEKTDSTIYLLEAGPVSDRILFVPPGRGN